MKKTLIFVIAVIAAVSFGFILSSQDVEERSLKKYSGSVYENAVTDTYDDYLESNPERPEQEITINGTDYSEFIDTEFNDNVNEEEFDGITGIHVPETGEISYMVNVENPGYYNIKIQYCTIEGRSSSISRGIKINEKYLFTESKNFVLSRIWEDDFYVGDKRVEGKHDVKPSQVEKQRWNTETIRDTNGYYEDAYLFYFKQGENKITLVGDREPVIIGSITLFQEKELSSYQDVYQNYTSLGYQKQAEGLVSYKVQGEQSFEKSSPSLTPQANYSSFKVEPYQKFITYYNTIGGVNWSVSGDWISWKVNAPESGLYKITIKALQNYNRGLQTSRILYINDEIPFAEARHITFNYNSDWQNVTLGDANGDYWFYFEKGDNEIKLVNTIGAYGNTVKVVNEVIADLNWIYRKVIMRTGIAPNKYTDYFLEQNIPNLYPTINKSIENLTEAIESVISISGSRSDLISSLERTKYQLETFKETEKKIQVGLDELETNITALGTWVTTVSDQPLLIDYILIHGENADLAKATTNFFQKMWHDFTLLIGSYGADTSLESSVSVDGPTIEVWIMTGRDQSNLLRQLIDESFTLQNGINVRLKLVTATVLLPATLSGNGPDVAIGVAQNIPVNWGIRNSVVDLTKFSDFEEYSKNFYSSAITPFKFEDSIYSLPDTQDFMIQFVRNDIFKEFNLVDEEGKAKVPTTWNEVIDLLPILQRQYLDYYLPNVTGSLSPLLYAMIEQYGGSLYLDGGAKTGIMEEESANAFYDFVDFYRNYGFAIDANFQNRFRTGEMPAGVSFYSLYNTLAVSAPEIRGNWEFALFPGYEKEGEYDASTTSTSTGTIILSQSKEQEAAWEFMKWWLGKDAQAGYARGMEAILGSAARYPTANVEAFASLPWSAKDYRILEKQRTFAKGVPTVPGDYIVGRYIDNAFRKIINDDINPSDSLFSYTQKINAELERKREEFNLG